MNKILASFTVKPVYLEEGNSSLGNWRLRKFQEEVRNTLEYRKDAIVTAVTGGGKTLSLLLGDEGFVGLYPNNTLLRDQQKSIDRILRLALNAKPIFRSYDDVLRIYEVEDGKGEVPVTSFRKVAVALLSGKYIGYKYDESGNLVPKRVYILKEVLEKIIEDSNTYVVTLGTPDTILMIMSGIYRNFEKVGYALHNAILASVEGESIDWSLSRYGVATVSELGDLAVIREYLLKYPWFIDEFHLYSDYEASLLLPILKVYRDHVGWEYPLVFSSATPSGGVYRHVVDVVKPKQITANIREEGSHDAFVRGATKVEVVAVSVDGRGLSKWLNIGFKVPLIVEERVGELKSVIGLGGNALIVVDRVNQIPSIVDVLTKHGIEPECSVTIKPTGCSESEKPVLVGSESISQGIDREGVRYGIISAYNIVSLIQRFGRVGRGVDSKVILTVPQLPRKLPIENLDGRTVSYSEFAKAVEDTYSNILISELGKCKDIEEFYTKRSKLVEVSTIIGYAQVSKPRGIFDRLAHILRSEAYLLDMFYGAPEIIAKTLTFRSSGFPVVVRKNNGNVEIGDIGVVLRNFTVKNVELTLWRDTETGVKKKMIAIDIDLEPSRSVLIMEISPRSGVIIHEGLAKRFEKTVTTIGEMAGLGYRLIIKSGRREFTVSPSEILKVPDVREQTIAVLRLSEEILSFYTYTVQGVEIRAGEKSVVGLFI